MTTIDLDPDRLLPAEPSQRDVARRLYQGVRGLPIVSPHGHVDPLLLLENAPFDNPASLFVTPDHYVTRMLHAQGVPLDALGIPRRGGDGGVAGPRGGVADALRALGCLPWDPLPLLDRGRAGRGLRGPDPALGGRCRPALRSAGRALRASRVPPAGSLPALRGRGPGHHRRPLQRPRRPPQPRRGPLLERKGGAHLPARRPPRSVAPGLVRPPGRARTCRRRRHPALPRLPRGAGGPAPLLQGARCDRHRPRAARPRHRDAQSRARRARSSPRPCWAGRPPTSCRRSGVTCSARWPGCRATTAW